MKKHLKTLTGAAAALGGLAWYLRGWQPVSDEECARLTEPAPGVKAGALRKAPLLGAIDPEALRRDTAALAAINPRHGGTPGEAEAREWVARRFREVGLERVRLEPFVYPRWVGEGVRLTLLGSPAAELPCLAFNGSAATPDEGVKAPLIDVGNGLAKDYARLESWQTSGRIHLAWSGALHRRDVCLNAGRAGAVGVILARSDPEMPDLVEMGTAVVLGRLPALSVSHSVGERLRQAANQGQRAWLNVDCRYTLGRSYNVVGELPGRTQEYVALIAHYDAWYSGAADNAAGVAALLALAQAWQGLRPKRTLRFVSTAAEEEGLMGALADVTLRGLKIKRRCRGVVSLDVVGAPGETLWVVGEPSQLRGATVAIGRGLGYPPAAGGRIDVYAGRIYGDHWPYNQIKIPGVMLSKHPYRYYHTPYDLPDRLDYQDARYQAAIGGTLAWRMAHTL